MADIGFADPSAFGFFGTPNLGPNQGFDAFGQANLGMGTVANPSLQGVMGSPNPNSQFNALMGFPNLSPPALNITPTAPFRGDPEAFHQQQMDRAMDIAPPVETLDFNVVDPNAMMGKQQLAPVINQPISLEMSLQEQAMQTLADTPAPAPSEDGDTGDADGGDEGGGGGATGGIGSEGGGGGAAGAAAAEGGGSPSGQGGIGSEGGGGGAGGQGGGPGGSPGSGGVSGPGMGGIGSEGGAGGAAGGAAAGDAGNDAGNDGGSV